MIHLQQVRGTARLQCLESGEMSKDYYAILGVPRSANSATIHSAFRALARQYHPDAGRESSSSKFREVLEAYRTLSDPARQRQHDIDLGRTIRSRKPAAEPLFAATRSRTTSIRPEAADWGELVTDLLSLIESEFDLALRFRRTFFY